MRIWAIVEGVEKEAYRMGGTVYKCFPRSTNDKTKAEEFTDIADAAMFLLANRGWGIRMNPGTAIIYDGINIALD